MLFLAEDKNRHQKMTSRWQTSPLRPFTTPNDMYGLDMCSFILVTIVQKTVQKGEAHDRVYYLMHAEISGTCAGNYFQRPTPQAMVQPHCSDHRMHMHSIR